MFRIRQIAFLIILLIPSFTFAASLWQDANENSIAVQSSQRWIVPSRYRTLQLNRPILESILRAAPFEFTSAAKLNHVVLEIPLPNGKLNKFRIEESPIMEPQLAAQFPEIRTYRGQGLDDPTATVRFDLTPFGFHAMILSAGETIFVDPYQRGDLDHYVSYRKSDLVRADKGPSCLVDETMALIADGSLATAVSSGSTLRTYRLALAADGEYTGFYGGTKPQALAGMTTTMNRVNAIYEREVAVRMVLIANEMDIIYTNPNTDPYTNTNGVAMLGQNQSNLDSVIGSANYDIGHVFSTGGGGVAFLQVVCSNGAKAGGVTGLLAPVGDAFDVDYVAHEMGHQFGGNHTFNATCGGNRNGSTAYEPGSGSTIMGYAGVCGSEDLQPHSDDVFHTISFDEIVSFTTIGNGNSCDVATATGNAAPTVEAGSNFTIPSRTPFVLTATGNDADGDALSYCWEEFDLGAAAPPDTDNGNRPIFRSFSPTTSPSRIFPRLSNILSNTSTFGESLPTTSRTMTFRATVRDNQSGGGGVNYDSMQVTTVASAGPFAVTQPNTALMWAQGSMQNILWNVAGTSGAPINTANVQILLSTDGGNTFPTVLNASTANDGSETVTLPMVNSTNCRIKIQAINNIYFDISNANFTIGMGGGGACLFCDEFDNSALDSQWTYGPVSAWSEDGQNLVAQSNKKSTAIANPVYSGCSTCTILTSVQTAGGPGSQIRLIGWYQDDNNRVELISKEEIDKWILKQYVGGSLVMKAKGTAATSIGVFHNIQIQFDGTNFIATVDGIVIITMPKASGSSPAGTVGFSVKKTTGTFASIAVN